MNPALLAMFDAETKREHGGVREPRKSEPDGAEQEQDGKIDNIQLAPAPTGNTKQAAVRRLRKDRPDLLARVVAGELSAHAAATSQRAMVAARLATLKHGGDRKSDQAANLPVDAATQAEAAARVNVSPRSVASARAVLAKAVPEVVPS